MQAQCVALLRADPDNESAATMLAEIMFHQVGGFSRAELGLGLGLGLGDWGLIDDSVHDLVRSWERNSHPQLNHRTPTHKRRSTSTVRCSTSPSSLTATLSTMRRCLSWWGCCAGAVWLALVGLWFGWVVVWLALAGFGWVVVELHLSMCRGLFHAPQQQQCDGLLARASAHMCCFKPTWPLSQHTLPPLKPN